MGGPIPLGWFISLDEHKRLPRVCIFTRRHSAKLAPEGLPRQGVVSGGRVPQQVNTYVIYGSTEEAGGHLRGDTLPQSPSSHPGVSYGWLCTGQLVLTMKLSSGWAFILDLEKGQ